MESARYTPPGGAGPFNYYVWKPVGDTLRGMVQIVHGMAEHAERYDLAGKRFAEAGFAVYAQDLPGHGRTAASEDDLGFFAESGGWDCAADAVHQFGRFIASEYVVDLPLIIIGHSMGSFLARTMMYAHPELYDAAVLSGTAASPGILGHAGKLIAARHIKAYGPKHRDRRLDAMTFGSYNRPFRPNRTPFDWLSRDSRAVDRYVEDPLCGFICTSAMFRDLLEGLQRIHDEKNLSRIPRELPVLIISGTKDPVGKFSKGPRRVHDQFKQLGLKDVTLRLYDQARHELFQETNREEVLTEVIQWCSQRVRK